MRKLLWFGFVIVIIIFDQITKYWALNHLLPYTPKAILPMLNLTLAHNTGAAFSFLHNAGSWHHWFFIIFSTGMSIGLIIWICRSKNTMQLLGLTLVLAGALGNLLDRLDKGYVVDFIDFHYKNYHWPVFNIADSVICIGAILLFLCSFRHEERS